MISRTSARFWTHYQKLPGEVKQEARKAYRLFLESPMHPSLHFERLVCDRRMWSVRISRDYRAVGLREGERIAWFWIGTHAEFDRRFPR